MHAARVALITLITPVVALLLGNLLNGKRITSNLAVGSILILLSLIAHQREPRWSLL